MTTSDAIAIVMAALLLIDLMGTIFVARGGIVVGTCDQCNWKCEGTLLWCLLRQTTHRCDDNLI